MSFSIIAAVAKNYCIGKNNKIPWHIPEDFQYFKKTTLGKTCLMGKKTFESILSYLGKPLPGRENAVITRDQHFKAPEGVLVFNSLDAAWKDLKDKDVFICGGADIYKQTIDRADNLFITWINQEPDGDVFFPTIDFDTWKEVWREDHDGFSWVKYIKKS
jgi:dihydrofolate reductase